MKIQWFLWQNSLSTVCVYHQTTIKNYWEEIKPSEALAFKIYFKVSRDLDSRIFSDNITVGHIYMPHNNFCIYAFGWVTGNHKVQFLFHWDLAFKNCVLCWIQSPLYCSNEIQLTRFFLLALNYLYLLRIYWQISRRNINNTFIQKERKSCCKAQMGSFIFLYVSDHKTFPKLNWINLLEPIS